MERCHLNKIYEKLDKKAHEVCHILHSSFGYYNGHYSKNQCGDYEIDYFPIPVISIQGLCDIEIGLEQISVTAKLTREKAVSYNYEKVKDYSFETYGVEDYLNDFFIAEDTQESMIEKILKSKEENIFFSFYFSYDAETVIICEFVKFIAKEGFFY